MDNYTPAKISRRSVVFLGKPINLSKLAREIHVSHALLSRIFSGDLAGSVYSITRIADKLGLTVEETLAGIEQRRKSL